jgi:transmembrane sensor
MTERERAMVPPELEETLAARPDGASLKAVWQALEAARPSTRDDAAARTGRAEAWAALQARLAEGAPSTTVGAGPTPASTPVVALGSRRRPVARWLAAAAALAVAIGIGSTARPVTVTAAPGRTATVDLPDGTRVALDGGSTIRYRRGFRAWWGAPSSVREVTLEGQGFFAVAKDGRPFTVHTYNADVRVLGTRFAVHATSGARGATRVEVEEGRVRVAGRAAAVELAAGERAEVSADAEAPSPPAPIAVERVATWRRGGFAAVDVPLGRLLDELARHAGVTISLRDDEAADEHLTVYYPGPTAVGTILQDLATARGLTLRQVRGGYTLE